MAGLDEWQGVRIIVVQQFVQNRSSCQILFHYSLAGIGTMV